MHQEGMHEWLTSFMSPEGLSGMAYMYSCSLLKKLRSTECMTSTLAFGCRFYYVLPVYNPTYFEDVNTIAGHPLQTELP